MVRKVAWAVISIILPMVLPVNWFLKFILLLIMNVSVIYLVVTDSNVKKFFTKYNKTIVIGSISGLSILLVLFDFYVIHDQWIEDQPVAISPTKFTSYAGVFDNRTLFEVHNRSDETIYTTWVKILAEKPSFEEFQTILITDDGRRFVKPEGGELFNPEVLMMTVLDKDKQPVIFLIFRSLTPKETWRFRFYVQSGRNIPRNQSMTFRLSVLDYKQEPYPYGVKGDAAFFQFKIPEGFTFIKGKPFFLMLEKISQANKIRHSSL